MRLAVVYVVPSHTLRVRIGGRCRPVCKLNPGSRPIMAMDFAVFLKNVLPGQSASKTA